MTREDRLDRRQLLAAGIGLAAALPPLAASVVAPAGPLNPDEGVTAPEDLMKEHGVLNRCLLVYEEGMRRLRAKQEVAPEVFLHTAELVRTFVEEYHERNEEKYIFPEFEKAKKLVDLVATLKTQHLAGRRVTAEILRLSQPALFRSPASRTQLVAACQAFIRMYRPHEAREDTVLFPALRTILSAKQVAALGDRMEEDEHKVLGEEGFERSVDKVAALEVQLGINDLKQFTPRG
ncbi:MAG TPA: hemerythrin domain-containing protein [Thermoanaerobaculia bacterium]|nr:hemerythrin domain-containing protein [Thermoanaerobaculia bacterium]